jgi:hypothetical protein
MDPATIGLLISIAPTVLDLLFGRGSDFQSRSKNSALQARSKNNIIKHETLLENPEEMYGYGLEGYGYRYPRRRRQITVETYYPESVQPEFVRTAVFNRAVAAKNPWLEFLHRNEYFKKN